MADFFFNTTLGTILLIIGQIFLVVIPLLLALAFLMYADRKIWASVQLRRGPNVVGIYGLLQSFADFAKYIVKEVVVPAGADRAVFFMAPMVTLVMALVAWAVIPFNDGWVLSNINVAILYVFAISSLEVYGVIMGGWASNSKYPFLGSLRSAAQMISYEVSIGLIIIGVVISSGSLNFGDIVLSQSGDYGLLNWYWLPHFPMLILFFISALAETNRHPFDMPEAEAELVAGYNVEYSAMTFALFFLGEYANMILMAGMTTILFLGGWLPPMEMVPFTLVPGPVWFAFKIAAVLFIFLWVRATFPRYRYDQLMRLGWKVFLPISLAAVVVVGGAVVAFDLAPVAG